MDKLTIYLTLMGTCHEPSCAYLFRNVKSEKLISHEASILFCFLLLLILKNLQSYCFLSKFRHYFTIYLWCITQHYPFPAQDFTVTSSTDVFVLLCYWSKVWGSSTVQWGFKGDHEGEKSVQMARTVNIYWRTRSAAAIPCAVWQGWAATVV